ncbi:MAG: tRNA 2-thiouridine(34) synthase MnmA [Candidatus Omnitrophota bacterium]
MKRVVVAMSGGVDSSVAAFLLKEQGFEVIGLTMRLWADNRRAVADAKRVAAKLGIPHHVIDLRREFERDVIRYFCSEYIKGRTPNPCVVCNRMIKFGKLLEKAKMLGADLLATGHYARIGRDAASARFYIRQAADKSKDQSYFLFDLGQRQLARLSFPLGELEKSEVKRIAKSAGLKAVQDKPESQDICFITRKGYREFISGRVKGIRPGRVVDTRGKYMGTHKGIAFYTIGQREGLGIAAGKPIYVVKLNPRRNEVVVGDAAEVKGRELTAKNIRWMYRAGLSRPVRAQAKIRYNHWKSACRITPLSSRRVKAVFDEPQHAITPGQALVVYDGEKILGGGWIE